MQLTGTSDRDFMVNVGRIVEESTLHLEDWDLDEVRWNKILPFWLAWVAAYETSLDPKKRNQEITEAKNAARVALTPLMRKWIDYLRGNELITDEDEKRLGIFEEPHSNQPTPTTSKSPMIFVKLDVIRRIGGYFHIAGEISSRGKPDGVSAIEMAWAKRSTPPDSINDLIHENITLYTRNTFTLDFDESERGEAVYLAARYVMRADVSGYGPWGEIIFAVIP